MNVLAIIQQAKLKKAAQLKAASVQLKKASKKAVF